MNPLLIIGMIILLGTVGGRIFKKINLPSVTGYIIIGLLIGESFHGFLSGGIIDSFRPLISLALGIIGFMIGSEIHLDRFKRYSRSIYTILFMEAFLTSASRGIVPIVRIDGVPVGTGRPGPVTGALTEAFDRRSAELEEALEPAV